MRRIAKNSCGFSGYTCIGIPRLMYQGMYKDLVALDIQRTNPSQSSVISVRSWLSSCDLGTPDPVQGFSECPESPTSTAYIWYNFGLLPTEICIYDKTAKASDLSLSLGLTELCQWTYDRYSHQYVSVAQQIGGSVLVSDCYVKEQQNNVYKRVQHYPGILDPAHPIPDITVPDIYVPTLAPQVRVTIPEPPAADVAPAAFQAANAGNIAAAIAGSNQDKCPNDFATVASIAAHSSDKTTYTISVAEGRFTVFGLDGTEIGRGTAEDLTTPVDVVADATVTRYAVCVITATETKSQASATAMYEFAAQLVLRTNMTDTPEANTVQIPVAIITMGCVQATQYTSKFSTPAVNPDDDFSIKIDTSWLQQAFSKYLEDMDAQPGGKCAANIKQLLCGPIKLGIQQFHTAATTAGDMLLSTGTGAVVVNTSTGPTLMQTSIGGVADAQGTTVDRFAIAHTNPSKATLQFVGATDNAGVYIPYICNGTFALDLVIATGSNASKTPALVYYNTDGVDSVTFTENQTALIYYSGVNNQVTTVSIADTDNGILASNKGTLKWVALPAGGGLLQTTSEGGLSIFEAGNDADIVYVLAGNGSTISSLALPTVSKSDGDTGSSGDTDEGTSVQALGWDGSSFDWVTIDIPTVAPSEQGLYFVKGGTTAGAPEWQSTGLGTQATPENQALRWTGTAFQAINILIAPTNATAAGCATRWNGTSFQDTAPLLLAPSSDTGDKQVLAYRNGKLINVEAPKGQCTCVTPDKTDENYALTFDGQKYGSIAIPTTPGNTGQNQALTYENGTYGVINVAPTPETETQDTDTNKQALGWDGSKFTVVTIPNATTGLTIPELQADQALSTTADGALVGIDVVTPTNIGNYAVTYDNIATYLDPYTDSTTVSNIVSDYVASSGGAPTVTTGVNQALTYDGTSWGTVSLLDTPVSSDAATDVLDWDGSAWIRRQLLDVLAAPDGTEVYVLCARNKVPEWIRLRLNTVPSIVQ